tara:strand:- start:81 stop:308 length:228 start_codon:yes stop_codon:yes gene_type:complete
MYNRVIIQQQNKGSKLCFLLAEKCLRGHKASLLEGSAQTGQDTRGLFISRDLSSKEHGTLPEKLWVRFPANPTKG